MSQFETILESFFRSPRLADLPARVREAITRREWANELLVRSIQMLVVLLFCLIYAISPKTSPDGVFSPVPWVLAVYFVISAAGLFWGWLRHPPDWSVYISIFFDFCLLYGLMLSFHLQYTQPASFILKAPALLYVFIFIAIRALRFNPKFVIAAGAFAALGWALLIFYVLKIDPDNNMLTRSYVTYLTSNTVLIGAEVDKILSILFVTTILALVVNGSNNLLVTAVSEQSAAADLSQFFDKSVAHDIRASAAPLRAGEGEKRQATILNIDIRGFTRLAAKLDASTVMQLLSLYQGRIVPIVQANGGVIDKFMGDGILATFGTTGSGKTAAADGLRAAEQIMLDHAGWEAGTEALAALKPLDIGLGLASGLVSYGAVGGDGRLEMTVIGPPVNFAAKLEKHNKTLRTAGLCDAATWSLARRQGFEGLLVAKPLRARIDGVSRLQNVHSLALPLRPRKPRKTAHERMMT